MAVVGDKIQETGFLLITDFKLLNQMKEKEINYCDF